MKTRSMTNKRPRVEDDHTDEKNRLKQDIRELEAINEDRLNKKAQLDKNIRELEIINDDQLNKKARLEQNIRELENKHNKYIDEKIRLAQENSNLKSIAAGLNTDILELETKYHTTLMREQDDLRNQISHNPCSRIRDIPCAYHGPNRKRFFWIDGCVLSSIDSEDVCRNSECEHYHQCPHAPFDLMCEKYRSERGCRYDHQHQPILCRYGQSCGRYAYNKCQYVHL